MTSLRDLKKELNKEYKDDDICMTSGKKLKEYKVTEFRYKNLLKELEQFKGNTERQVQGMRTREEENKRRSKDQIRRLKDQIKELKGRNK